jgi:hypothetical protein
MCSIVMASNVDAAGIPRDDLIFRVHIHETADVAAAHLFWLGLTGAPPAQFRRPVLKRHNPKTVRKNVRRSGDLYRRIQGWAEAAMAGPVLSARSA